MESTRNDITTTTAQRLESANDEVLYSSAGLDSCAPTTDNGEAGTLGSGAEAGTEQASLSAYVDEVAIAPEGVRYTGTPRSDSISASSERDGRRSMAAVAVIASAVTKFLAARQLEHLLEPWNINRIALESQIEEQRINQQLPRPGDAATATASASTQRT